uniref:zona pellucida sperm-binding protein 3 receptor-like isoform X1 n=1 Tax=Myodes glareolus TaxID=447135 RepID=UPI0020227AC0|nr:zona pellucida sperm-binding protein 3 receptor-like isoform X1 [Myodes glareolus]XP_048286596.1 zona pellucida sperm-binding protein 3 receptor-like isoform X1 [Myodes glareolus]
MTSVRPMTMSFPGRSVLERRQIMCSPRASHPLTKSSALNRKGIKTAWSFLELWKTSHSILFQMTLATVLMAPVLGDCGPPPSLPFASPINQLYGTSFSPGTILKYACRHGFRKVNSSLLTCDENGSWIYAVFCVKKRCRNPGELVNGKVEITTDLFLGSTVDFSCGKGYLLMGSATSRCVVQGKGVDWSDPLPECVIVTCESPPDISNGKHSGRDEDLYTYGSSVTYSCDPNFTLLGNASIVCTVVNKTVGVWSPSPPACQNGCTDVPDIPYASWEGNKFPLRNFEIFVIGTKLKYRCKPGYRPVVMEPQIVTCQENLTWTPSKGCERACCPTPNMNKIKIVSERRDLTGMCLYAYGDYVFYICAEGSYPMSTDGRSSCQADGRWEPAMPSCQGEMQSHVAVTSPSVAETVTKSNKYISDNEESSRYVSARGVCPKPVITHGSLSVEKEHYAETDNVTIQCDTGYDLVGSSNIICSENRTWYPGIPSCKTEASEECRQVNEGKKLLQCLPSPDDVKKALEVYKLSLEIERLEQEKGKWIRIHKKTSKHVKIKGPFRPFG